MRADIAIARHEFRIMRTYFEDPLLQIFMPLLLMLFLQPVFAVVLASEGHGSATGAEQAVPGLTVLFQSLLMGGAGYAFIREHIWQTWDRLRLKVPHPRSIIVGKVIPYLAVSVGQMLVLFTVGHLAMGLDIGWSAISLLVIGLLIATCLMSFAVLVTAIARSNSQVNAMTTISAMVFSTFGGAIAPLSLAPEWVRTVSPLTPTYWAMDAYRAVLLERVSLGGLRLPIVMLIAFTAVFSMIAGARFRVDEAKTIWG